MEYKILGFNKFKSKKGSDYCTIQLSRDFSANEIAAGSCGHRVEDAFLPMELAHLAVPSNVGKLCDLYFNRNGYLIDIVLND